MHPEQGEIFFNVNAEPESALRRRNRGKIRIRMAVIKPRLRP